MNAPENSIQERNALPPGVTEDRRTHPHLRVIFDDACNMTAPFFDPAQSWNGMSMTFYARKALQEAYPDLTQQNLAILFSAVQRFHKERASTHQEPEILHMP